MKVFISELKKIDWLSAAFPKTFTDLPENSHFVFYYDFNKTTGLFDIREMSVDYFINDAIYKKKYKTSSYLVGFLKQPFSTDNTVLYLLLKSFLADFYTDNAQEYFDKLDSLFINYKITDRRMLDEKPSEHLIGSFSINNVSELETALSNYINKEPLVQGCIKIAEMIHGYLDRMFHKPFYSQTLTKIVNALDSPIGGLVPETTGTLRYMVVGEHSLLPGEDKSALAKAKEMLRSGDAMKKIFYDTGWWLNDNDGKWRKRISDEGWFIDKRMIRTDKMMLMMTQEGKSAADVYWAIQQVGKGSDVSDISVPLGEAFKHPFLYKYYPQLYDVQLLYLVSKDAKVNTSFYYSPEINVLVYFCHQSEAEDKTFLHESQHAVQGIENFGNGGNLFFSNVISSIGGGDFRSFMYIIKYLQDKVCKAKSKAEYENIISYMDALEKNTTFPVKQLKNYVESFEVFEKKCGELFFPLLANAFTLPETEYITKKYFAPYLRSNEIELISDAYEAGEKTLSNRQALRSQGWRDEEIQALYYNIYLGLLGEMEARESEVMQIIKGELADYFYPLTSETVESRFITVYNDDAPDTAKAIAGVELTPEGKYIIHLRKSSTAEHFIHEAGHILYDHIGDENKMIVGAEYAKHEKVFSSVEEFFVEAFICWIVKSHIDVALSEDFSKRTSEQKINCTAMMNNEVLGTLFDTVFYLDKNMDGYLKLLQAKSFIDVLRKSI